MNLLFLTLLYPNSEIEEVLALSKDGMQNQANNYQNAMLTGLRLQLRQGEELRILNALPVGSYPACYRKLLLKRREEPKEGLIELGCVNLPPFKQWGRARGAYREIVKWMKESKENRTVLAYSQYTPYMQAYRRVKKRFPDARCCVIVTDLPNEWGIDTGRRGLLKRLERRDGRMSLRLLEHVDGYVLLTQAMSEVLPMDGKQTCVVEGLINSDPELSYADVPHPEKDHSVALYTGTLNREFGLGVLLDAFEDARLRNCELWLCGNGDMTKDVEVAAARNPRIRYFGFLPLEKTLALQQKATVLVNPRPNDGLFTRYSFPSKTLEYMRAGKPVLCHRLDGYPKEYDDYLRYIGGNTAKDMIDALCSVLSLPQAQRAEIGERARLFVLKEKNALRQSEKVMALLRKLNHDSAL